MNTIKLAAAVLLTSFAACLHAQETLMDTVVIHDRQLQLSENFRSIKKLSSATYERNSATLADLLRSQSIFQIRENGRGMTASPFIHGTTAAQTAFLWNGISINSNFLGQADVNNLGIHNFDEIEVTTEGGSLSYGSSAIAGTVHLNNPLSFNRGFSAQLFLEAGSFNTFINRLKTAYSDNGLSVTAAYTHVSSENQYTVPEKNFENINGHYQNRDMNFGVAKKLGGQHLISLQTQLYSGDQHYPVFDESATKPLYKTYNFRSLGAWDFRSEKIQNALKLAYVEERFRYFADENKSTFNGGIGKNKIIKNDLNIAFSKKLELNVLTEYQNATGEGLASGIGDVERNTTSLAGVLRSRILKNISAEAGVRKDFVVHAATPVLFSGVIKYFVDKWESGLRFSKNYRLPTFNDLYWQPGGNPDLLPENSLQLNFTNQIKLRGLKLTLSPYYLNVKNMIVWTPRIGNIWAPENFTNIRSYGFDAAANLMKKWSDWQFNVDANYSFVHSINAETKNLQPYIPQHRAVLNSDLNYRQYTLWLQGNYTSQSYTTENNAQNEVLPAYLVWNAGLSAMAFKSLTLGIKINNIFDEIYATTPYYFMPKRNFSIYLKYNFKTLTI